MVKCPFSRLSMSLQAVKLFFRAEGKTAEFEAEFKLRTIAWALVRYKSFRLSSMRTGTNGVENLFLEGRVIKCLFTGENTEFLQLMDHEEITRRRTMVAKFEKGFDGSWRFLVKESHGWVLEFSQGSVFVALRGTGCPRCGRDVDWAGVVTWGRFAFPLQGTADSLMADVAFEVVTRQDDIRSSLILMDMFFDKVLNTLPMPAFPWESNSSLSKGQVFPLKLLVDQVVPRVEVPGVVLVVMVSSTEMLEALVIYSVVNILQFMESFSSVMS